MLVSIEADAPKRLGNALLGAALFAYGGRLDSRGRARLMDSWMTTLSALGISFHRKADDSIEGNHTLDKGKTVSRSKIKSRAVLSGSTGEVEEIDGEHTSDSEETESVTIYGDREGISLTSCGLCTKSEMIYWTTSGLPCDRVSRCAETASLIMRYAENGLWPWILEGPLQGVSSCWLKQVYENQPMTRADQESDIHSASIVEVRMNWIERDLVRTVHESMEKGSILIVHVDEDTVKNGRPLHPIFAPLMNLHTYVLGRPPADDVNSGEEDEEDEEWIDSNATPRLLPSTVWDPVTKSAIS